MEVVRWKMGTGCRSGFFAISPLFKIFVSSSVDWSVEILHANACAIALCVLFAKERGVISFLEEMVR